MANNELQQTIQDMVPGNGRGILAADESLGTIGKRFDTINVENTEEHRRTYRSLMCTTPDLGKHISGVILFEETLSQNTNNSHTIPAALAEQNIVPGIKVDKGLVTFSKTTDEKVTQGLDGLADRLQNYKAQGARFAKWRAVYNISDNNPSQMAIRANAEMLARYAAICQANGFVPIVEPEVLMDGDHTLARCAEASEAVFTTVFDALAAYQIELEHIILKPNMVIPGKNCASKSSPEAIAEATIKVLQSTVPEAVPSINFLSGGQSAEEATINLNAINNIGKQPWQLSFSYGRALQEPCLKAWGGSTDNIDHAQGVLFKRAKLNAAATVGKYNASAE